MNLYEVNRCSFPFDKDFKALIKNERESPKVQALKTCITKDQFEKVQEELRMYLKQKYPDYFKIRYSDMFAFAIALIHPHLDKCTTWKDVKFHCLDESNDEGFDWTCDPSFTNMKSFCVCGHSITACNSFIVYHEDGPLRIVVGCCCIEKNEIIDDFPLVKKRRKEQLKKHKDARIQQQIDTWKNYNDKLMHMHRTRTHTSCQTCKNPIKAGYKVCWGCHQKGCRPLLYNTIDFDTCSCGKQKQKKYPKCYTCNVR